MKQKLFDDCGLICAQLTSRSDNLHHSCGEMNLKLKGNKARLSGFRLSWEEQKITRKSTTVLTQDY